jgi:hypothetical protein
MIEQPKNKQEGHMEDGKKAELLLDHYKDTFEHILYHWKSRNRLFIFIIIIIALMGLDLYRPRVLSQCVNAYIVKTLSSSDSSKVPSNTPSLDFDVIGSAVWFILLALVIEYYHRSIHLDRQYKYITKLEEQICAEMKGDFVTREGKAYLSATGVAGEGGKRPLFLRAIGPMYVYFFPAFLTFFVVFKVWKENVCLHNITDWFNIIIVCAILFYNVLYFTWVEGRK